MKKIFYLTLILFIVFISACKKDKKVTPVKTTDSTAIKAAALDLLKDSLYLYTKETYLWHDQLPTYDAFKPRSFTAADPFTALQNEMTALSQYAINPTTNKPYEYYVPSPGHAKYSFVDDGTVGNELNGTKGDFGFDYNYNDVNDIRIVYVYPGSPAGLAGLTRGCQITAINDNTSISFDGVSNGHTYGSGTNANNNFVYNAIFNSGNIKLTVTKLDGTTFTTSLATTSYTVNPVLKEVVLDEGAGQKIGYFVFNSFTSDANADAKLDAVMSDFATQGVTDLVVDLRYNGGGYVSTAEHLDNLIVPAGKSGSLMYSTYYNNTLTAGTEVLLKNQVYRDNSGLFTLKDYIDYQVANNTVNFAKIGSLNVNRVFFIVTGGTASASELTINNLIPHMDVQLVGRTTYGKPVGFFGINIGAYTFYTPQFSTRNSANQGDYFAGMTPNNGTYNGIVDYDDYTKDFGDPTELLLSHIVNKVKTGTYSISGKVTQSIGSNTKTFAVQPTHNGAKFTGMIMNHNKTHIKR